MALQKKDYKRAMVLWRDLAKRCPDDPVIQGFEQILPEEARAQDEESSEYDSEEEKGEESEDYGEEEKSSSSGEETDPEERKQEEERKAQELAELGDPGEGYEWASDVDS